VDSCDVYVLGELRGEAHEWLRGWATILLTVNQPKNKRRNAWNWLLVVPALALAFPAMYSRPTPELFGFPFFYWYQIGWILISAVITGIVYFATENK
jgi:Protein of unknown function (DUF3311)